MKVKRSLDYRAWLLENKERIICDDALLASAKRLGPEADVLRDYMERLDTDEVGRFTLRVPANSELQQKWCTATKLLPERFLGWAGSDPVGPFYTTSYANFSNVDQLQIMHGVHKDAAQVVDLRHTRFLKLVGSIQLSHLKGLNGPKLRVIQLRCEMTPAFKRAIEDNKRVPLGCVVKFNGNHYFVK